MTGTGPWTGRDAGRCGCGSTGRQGDRSCALDLTSPTSSTSTRPGIIPEAPYSRKGDAGHLELPIVGARTTRDSRQRLRIRTAAELRGSLASFMRASKRSSSGRLSLRAVAFRSARFFGELLNHAAAPVVLFDRAFLGHRFSPARYVRKGKPNSVRSAFASSLVRAVVHTMMSMPQTVSMLS